MEVQVAIKWMGTRAYWYIMHGVPVEPDVYALQYPDDLLHPP